MAVEAFPAHFRPGNQQRLVRARAMNETPGDPDDFLPGLGDVRSGNGTGDNGLGRRGEQRRLNKIHAEITAQRQEKIRAQAIGPQPTKKGKIIGLQVTLTWAGNSLFAERQAVQEAFGLVPVATWGTREIYSTAKWGDDAAALKTALDVQPIVSVFQIEPIRTRPVLAEHLPEDMATGWELIRKIDRPRPGTFWAVSKRNNGLQVIWAATLYETVDKGKNTRQVVRTDNLNSEKAVQDYIKAYEVRHGDIGAVGDPRRVAFWASIDRKTSPPPHPGLNGLGELATGPMAIAGLALFGAYLLAKNR